MRAEAFRWFVRGAGFAVGVGLVVVFALGLQAALKVLVLVFASILLASGLEPLVGRLRSRLPLGRATTILVVYVTFFLVVVAMAIIVVPGALLQFGDLSAQLRPFFDTAQEFVATLEPRAFRESASALIGAARDALSPDPPDAGEVVEVGVTVAEAVISIVTMLAIVFFWLTEHARLQRYALAFLPASHRAAARETWNEVEGRLGGWVRGQLLIMGSVGILAGAAYFFLGLESWVFLAVFAALAEAIPIVGPVVGAIPALIVAATRGPEFVVAVAVVYVLVQLLEGNVLIPMIMRNTVGISPFLVIFSILVGAAVGGIVGAFLAVPLVAAFEIVAERLQARDVPVAQDPSSATTPSEEGKEAARRSLPDATDPSAV